MKSVNLKGSKRSKFGRKDSKLLRKTGMIPCVLYGGKEVIHFSVDELAFNKVIDTPEVFIVKINIDDIEYDTTIQDVQYHPTTDNVNHIDFYELTPDKKVTIKIPLLFTGSSIGVLKGGVLVKKMKKAKIKAMAAHLPDNITIDISNLEVGESIRISDIKIDNVEIVEIPSSLVVGVRTARTVVEEVVAPKEGEVAAEGAAAPAAAPAAEKAPEKDKKGKA